MADGDDTEPRERRVPDSDNSNRGARRTVEIDVELRDSLPGGRAVIAVEQDGSVTWLADKHYVDPKAVADLRAEMRRMVEEGWQQNWPGAS
ncbi:hypothetical protein ACH419_39575 [Streptomyces bobili]|uniref:hypothetical protein n=1 Tax=Streptomyces bobili TaxID=67280 RepID=UPI0037ACD07D